MTMLKEIINTRRAFRSLTSFTVTGELIQDLAECAQLSPSCFNNQPWRYVFIYEPTVLAEVHGALPDGNVWVKAASLIIAVFSREDLDCLIKEREYFLFDTGMATAFMILRATEMGLVAHPIAGYDEAKVKSILAIPEDMRLITLVAVGPLSPEMSPVLNEKQRESEAHRPPRKPMEEWLFHNRFN
jgi:nitroreductase